MTLCKDCTFFTAPDACHHPVNYSRVTGSKQAGSAAHLREDGGKCGPGANLFAARGVAFPGPPESKLPE